MLTVSSPTPVLPPTSVFCSTERQFLTLSSPLPGPSRPWRLAPNPSQPVRPDDKESQGKSNASHELDAIFWDSGYESGSNSNPGEDEDDSDDSNDDTFDDEGQLPPEHYLAQAESLDVSQRPNSGET